MFYCWSSYDPFISPCHHTLLEIRRANFQGGIAVLFLFFWCFSYKAIITSVTAWISRWCICLCVIMYSIKNILQTNGYYLLYYWTINLMLLNIMCNASCCNKFSVLKNNCVFVEHCRCMEDKWSKFRQH